MRNSFDGDKKNCVGLNFPKCDKVVFLHKTLYEYTGTGIYSYLLTYKYK